MRKRLRKWIITGTLLTIFSIIMIYIFAIPMFKGWYLVYLLGRVPAFESVIGKLPTLGNMMLFMGIMFVILIAVFDYIIVNLMYEHELKKEEEEIYGTPR